MEIKNKIKNSLDNIVIGAGVLLALNGIYQSLDSQKCVEKYLSKRTNLHGQVHYDLMKDGKVRATQYYKSKWGMFAPATYEVNKTPEDLERR